MNVTGSRRSIYYEIIQITPIGICQQLLQGRRCHTAPPKSCCIRINKESYAEKLYSIFFYWFYQLSTFFLYCIRTFLFHIKHLGHRRAKNICIQQANLIAKACQRYCQIGRHGTFSHTTFSATDSNNILDLWKKFPHLRTRGIFKLRFDRYINLFTQ